VASRLYEGEVIAVQDDLIKYRLEIAHPDVVDFGTDRLFAWKLLSNWISPPEEGTAAELAARYVKEVEVVSLDHASVVTTTDNSIVVKRLRGKRKAPVVTYAIRLTDAALLSGVRGGESEDVYEYVERVGAATPAKPSAPARKKSASEPLPPKTYEDLVATFVGLFDPSSNFDSEHFGDFIAYVAELCTDNQLTDWITKLPARPHGVRAASLVAVERATRGSRDSARHFLELALSYRASEPEVEAPVEHRSRDHRELFALVPAWWRLGHDARAAASFALLPPKDRPVVAILAGRPEHIGAFQFSSFREQSDAWSEIGPYLPVLLADGHGEMLHQILEAFRTPIQDWPGVRNSLGSMEDAFVMARFFERSQHPEGYLELVMRHSELYAAIFVPPSLRALERAAPAQAASWSKRVLDWAIETGKPDLRAPALATWAAVAPGEAAAWADGPGHELFALGAEGRAALLAASGRDHEALALVDDPSIDTIPTLTRDASVARAFLLGKKQHNATSLRQLDALGESAWVDAFLAKELAEEKPKTPAKRTLTLAKDLGRNALMLENLRLLSAGNRPYAAHECVTSCVRARDYTGAFGALESIPADRRFDCLYQGCFRLHDAVQTYYYRRIVLPMRAVPDLEG
jgi:hypothetical protein